MNKVNAVKILGYIGVWFLWPTLLGLSDKIIVENPTNDLIVEYGNLTLIAIFYTVVQPLWWGLHFVVFIMGLLGLVLVIIYISIGFTFAMITIDYCISIGRHDDVLSAVAIGLLCTLFWPFFLILRI